MDLVQIIEEGVEEDGNPIESNEDEDDDITSSSDSTQPEKPDNIIVRDRSRSNSRGDKKEVVSTITKRRKFWMNLLELKSDQLSPEEKEELIEKIENADPGK